MRNAEVLAQMKSHKARKITEHPALCQLAPRACPAITRIDSDLEAFAKKAADCRTRLVAGTSMGDLRCQSFEEKF